MARHLTIRFLVAVWLCFLLEFALVSAPAPVFREGRVPYVLTNSIGMKLACLPAGEFAMGSPEDEPSRSGDESVRRGVKIPAGFCVGVYEVTQKEYEEVTGKNPSYFSARGAGKAIVSGIDTGTFPVESVSWNDAVAFCKKLGERSGEKGRVYRLPTEAEWEYACRAGTKTATCFGYTLTSKQANFDGEMPYNGAPKGSHLGRPCRVGSYRPNAWGLYDMHGNVWEWTADWYGAYFKKKRVNGKPTGGKGDDSPVVRGGGWWGPGSYCRSAFRSRQLATATHNDGGFRVVFDPPAASR